MCCKTFLSSGLDSYFLCYVTVILGAAASHITSPKRHAANRTRRMQTTAAATTDAPTHATAAARTGLPYTVTSYDLLTILCFMYVLIAVSDLFSYLTSRAAKWVQRWVRLGEEIKSQKGGFRCWNGCSRWCGYMMKWASLGAQLRSEMGDFWVL